MIDYILWLLVVTLIQLSLLTLWFDSELLSPLLQYCLKQKAKNPRYLKWFVFSALTCPMCLGYWLAWGTAAVCCYLPGAPITGNIYHIVGVVFLTGLAAAILSRFVDGYMPEPISQKLLLPEYDVKLPEEESEDEEEKDED